MKGRRYTREAPDCARTKPASPPPNAILEQAAALLEEEVMRCQALGYQGLLNQGQRLSQREVATATGDRFSLCTQVVRPSSLECTLELRASIQWLPGDDVIAVPLRAAIAVRPDNAVTRL